MIDASIPEAPRLLSIDLSRGATIALMILVNDPGDPHCVYPPLAHAEWNGYTPADLIFPNFLFLSGASLVFSLQSRIARAKQTGALLPIAAQLARRSLNLIALKIVVAGFPSFRFRRVRLYGVLFRTALLSFLGGITLLLTLSIPILVTLIATLLTGSWLALRIPIHLATGDTLNQPLLDPDNNLAAHIDRAVSRFCERHLHFGALYNITHDPEGLLSSAPALASVLIGSIAALIIRDPRLARTRKRNTLALAGLACLTAGHLWNRTFPVNKNLWTSSYALASAGWSLLALSTLYTLYDMKSLPQANTLAVTSHLSASEAIVRPLQIFGANALPVYILSILGHKLARTLHLHRDGHSISLRTYVYRKLFAPTRSTPVRSLAFAVSYAALCFLPNLALWRRKIFLKI